MFERTRSNLVRRLGVLIDRFELIVSRAEHWRQKGTLSEKLDLGGTSSVFEEIEFKAREQLDLCLKSIEHLLFDRALPLIFKSGVAKAESFADQCEAILDSADTDWSTAEKQAQRLLGKSK